MPVDAPGRVIGPADEVFGRPPPEPRDPASARFHAGLAAILTSPRHGGIEMAMRIMPIIESNASVAGLDNEARTDLAEWLGEDD